MLNHDERMHDHEVQQLRTSLPWMQPEAERGWEVNTVPSAFEDAPPVRLNEDGSQTYGPYVTHPDITDRFSRVWVWHHGDIYLHDGISCPEKFIRDKDMQLPNRKLRGNPNYAGLCEICMSEW